VSATRGLRRRCDDAGVSPRVAPYGNRAINVTASPQWCPARSDHR
jgi:hypothetical protein